MTIGRQPVEEPKNSPAVEIKVEITPKQEYRPSLNKSMSSSHSILPKTITTYQPVQHSPIRKDLLNKSALDFIEEKNQITVLDTSYTAFSDKVRDMSKEPNDYKEVKEKLESQNK